MNCTIEKPKPSFILDTNNFRETHIGEERNYDSTADYWKLMNDGSIKFDGKAEWTDENGKLMTELNAKVGSGAINGNWVEYSLATILGIDTSNSTQMGAVRQLMLDAGLKHTGKGDNPYGQEANDWQWMSDDKINPQIVHDSSTITSLNSNKSITSENVLLSFAKANGYRTSYTKDKDIITPENYQKYVENIFGGLKGLEGKTVASTDAAFYFGAKMKGQSMAEYQKEYEKILEKKYNPSSVKQAPAPSKDQLNTQKQMLDYVTMSHMNNTDTAYQEIMKAGGYFHDHHCNEFAIINALREKYNSGPMTQNNSITYAANWYIQNGYANDAPSENSVGFILYYGPDYKKNEDGTFTKTGESWNHQEFFKMYGDKLVVWRTEGNEWPKVTTYDNADESTFKQIWGTKIKAIYITVDYLRDSDSVDKDIEFTSQVWGY